MTDPSNSRTDPVTNRELPTQTTESDKGLIVSLEFKAGSNRMDDTLLSQSETGLCVDLANRQSPGTMCTKETMRRTTRKYFVPRQGSGESTPHPALISSLFPKVPPVLRFVDEGCKLESLPWEFRRLLRWRASMLTPAVVRQALLRSGFRVSKLTSATEDLETIVLSIHVLPTCFASNGTYGRKVNHLPCSFQLGRKDRLWKNLVHMQMRCGKDSFNFMPQTFCLPTDLDALKKVWDEEGAAQRWILKPNTTFRFTRIPCVIFMKMRFDLLYEARQTLNDVVRYLARPFLINESKFDLRIYVYISSINPLRVYIHEDGLVRFASQKYTNSSRCLGNRFIHLTNYSINRLNSEYVSNTNDQATKGHKWSLRALWAYLRSQGISPAPVWSSIKDVVVKTAISTEAAFNAAVNSYCNHACSVHEVFGFDIFLDEDLQPWLLEVNVSPSMHSDSPLDAKIKGNMVRDMLNISGLHLPEPSDTNSHTVIPSCVVKSPVIRHQSSEFTDSVLRNPSPAVHFYSNGTMITPIIGTADADSSLGVTEQRLKNAGDMESSSPTIGRPTKKVRIPSHEWVIDSRLHLTQLSSDEREKRRYYIKRAIQYDFPKCSLYTPATGYRTSPATPNSIGSSPGMGNNNYQYSPESVSSKSSSIRSVGSTRIVGFQTSASSMGTVNNLPNCTVQSNISTPTPKSSATHGGHDDGDFIVAVADDDSDSNDNTGDDGDDDDGDDDDDDADDDDDDDVDYDNDDDGDDDDDDDDDEDLCTRNAKYSEVQLSDNTNNMCKKTARSMGIGPSSPDLRSHRVQNPNIFPGQNKETSNKPPTAPLSVRARISSKQSNEMRTGSNTPTCRSTHRSGYCSGTESPVKPHTLPRVRLASATADILECLTPSDLRILIGMVDELERAGGFECIFPPPSAGLAVRYLSYFEAPRYSNLLCIAYLQKYADDKEKGIEMLRKHCAKNVHLISSAQGDEVPRENQWHRYVRNKKLPGKERSPTVATTSPGQTGKSSHHRISQLAQS
ncbi:Tubulin polyglutamylase TTLL4 [Fasciola hepatica]|uniref:Tubulin polyglutamylase TTLL4 n=1 Tax=Fasciola hepatica TaxID=6192 RepID=A0A4E0S440_FASHE|nr:Tubulin polyglutamylase TTLL4 [Fasciola hepatica]